MSSNVTPHHELKEGMIEKPPEPEPNVDTSIAEFLISDIPSQGIPYPEGYSISYRPYTFGEIKKISSSKVSLYEMVKDIFIKGINCQGFDVLDLTVNDFLYISIVRRIATTGKGIASAEWVCDSCGKVNESEITGDMFDFHNLEVEEYPIKVTFENGEVYSIGALTLKNLLVLMDGGLDEEDEITVLALSIQDTDKSFKELYSMIESASYSDGEKLEKADLKLIHGLKPIRIECKQNLSDDSDIRQLCGNFQSIELESREFIISPFR